MKNSFLNKVNNRALSREHKTWALFINQKIIINTCFSFFLLLNTEITCQSNQEDDFSHYYSKAFKFSHNNNDSLIFYARKIQKSKSRCQKVDGILYEARGFYQKKNLKNSKRLVFKAIQQTNVNTEICDKKNLIDSYRRLFYIYKNEDKYDDALKYLLKREEIIESLPLKDAYYLKNVIWVRKSLADLKFRLGFLKEGLSILKNSYDQMELITHGETTQESHRNFFLEKANILNSIGDVFVYLNQREKNTIYLDSASYFYKKSYKIASSLPDPNANTEALYRMRQVNIIFERKDYDLALFYLKRYDSLFRRFPNHMSVYHLIKAICLRHEKRYDSAVHHSYKYLNQFGDKNSYNTNTIYIFDNLANIYYSKNKSDSALKYSNLTLEKYKEVEKEKRNTSIKIHAIELEEFKKLNQKLIQENEKSNISKYIIIFSSIFIFIVLLLSKGKKLKSYTDSKKRDVDNITKAKILKGLSDFEVSELFLDSNFTINSLAEYLETNSTYLSIVINNNKEKSFKQYIAELRINYVIERLKKDRKFTKYSIAAIADEVGYTNASSFTRVFKKQTGKTPSEFIKSIGVNTSSRLP